MSRRKTKPEDIRDKEHYCKKYVAMEVKHENIQKGIRAANEVSFEEHFSGDRPSADNTVNAYGDMDEVAACGSEGFDWIEYLDNPALFEAVSALSQRQKKILTLYAMKSLTTREIAAEIGIDHSNVIRNIQTVRKNLKIILEKPHQKR
jgi:RNA polymerase sigma factor (sigma-70 family)